MTRQGLLPALCESRGCDHQVLKSKGSVDGIPSMRINFPIFSCALVMVHPRICWCEAAPVTRRVGNTIFLLVNLLLLVILF